MQITVELPNDIAQRPEPGREALEALALEGYRKGTLSHFQAAQLLGLARIEFEGFLKERNILDHSYSSDDLEEDIHTMQELRQQGLLKA